MKPFQTAYQKNKTKPSQRVVAVKCCVMMQNICQSLLQHPDCHHKELLSTLCLHIYSQFQYCFYFLFFFNPLLNLIQLVCQSLAASHLLNAPALATRACLFDHRAEQASTEHRSPPSPHSFLVNVVCFADSFC